MTAQHLLSESYQSWKVKQIVVIDDGPRHRISAYLTKESSSWAFLRSLMYSPIIFLSSRGFSLSH